MPIQNRRQVLGRRIESPSQKQRHSGIQIQHKLKKREKFIFIRKDLKKILKLEISYSFYYKQFLSNNVQYQMFIRHVLIYKQHIFFHERIK